MCALFLCSRLHAFAFHTPRCTQPGAPNSQVRKRKQEVSPLRVKQEVVDGDVACGLAICASARTKRKRRRFEHCSGRCASNGVLPEGLQRRRSRSRIAQRTRARTERTRRLIRTLAPSTTSPTNFAETNARLACISCEDMTFLWNCAASFWPDIVVYLSSVGVVLDPFPPAALTMTSKCCRTSILGRASTVTMLAS
jgi:hypothetical protein